MIIKIVITMFEDQFDNNASLSYGQPVHGPKSW